MLSPPGSSRWNPGVTSVVWSALKVWDGPSCTGCVSRWFTFCTLAALAAAVGLQLRTCLLDLHVRFWLGSLPSQALEVLLASMAVAFLLLCYRVWAAALRQYQMEQERRKREASRSFGHDYGPSSDSRRWRLSARSLRLVFAVQVVLALAAAILGGLTLRLGSQISVSLTSSCGSSGATQEIEYTYQKLWDFRSRCHQQPDSAGLPTDDCPGFRTEFPAPAPYARYLKVLEAEEGCSGFCHLNVAPLFSLVGGAARRQACGIRLGLRLFELSQWIGCTAATLGGLLAITGLFGVCFADA